MAEENQNDKTIFSKIWNDTVWAGVISAAVCFVAMILFNYAFVKSEDCARAETVAVEKIAMKKIGDLKNCIYKF